MNNFYKKFKFFSHLPFWRLYLSRVYSKALVDATSLGVSSLERGENFTCLLCGVSGEITADEFIKFVLGKNPKSKIIIIDIGDEQSDPPRSKLRGIRKTNGAGLCAI